MHIVYASNDGYALPMGVSLYSLYEHNSDLPLAVHIFNDGISSANIEKLRLTAAHFNKELDIRPMPELDKIAGGNTPLPLFYGQLSLSTYLRLFLVSLLPSDISRVLWLDADTVVSGSIADMFTIDIDGKGGAGCLNVSAHNKRLHGFKIGESYYNAGIFIFNLDYWRKHGVYDAVLSEMKRRRGRAIDHDQDYLNSILRGNILTLDPRYNFMTHYYWMTIDYDGVLSRARMHPCEMYTKEVLCAAMEDVRIYHIINGTSAHSPRTVRPWDNNYCHPFADIWRQEAAKTQWKDTLKTVHNRADTPLSHRHNRHTALRRIKRFVCELFMYHIPPARKIYVKMKYGFWL